MDALLIARSRALRHVLMLLACFAATGMACVATADSTVPSAGAATSTPVSASTVKAALDDAARQTGVAVSRLKVVSAENVTWLDGSLGCPAPELMYTQALVPGFRIRIDAAGKMLDYHADARGTLVLCPPERSTPPH